MERPVIVFQGSVWESMDLQSKLEEAGITVISNYLANAGGHELYVSAAQADEALRIAQAQKQRASSRDDDELAPLRALGKRIAPLTMFVFTAPAGLVLGAVYLARARRLGLRPPEHKDFLLAWGASFLMSVVSFLFLLAFLHS